MEAVLIIDVFLDEVYEVHGKKGQASMLLFHGNSECKNFSGIILPGAVDTQKELKDEKRLLSARYILEGRDYTGTDCRIFIENNSIPESEYTKPLIYTDSKALGWLENENLYGVIEGKENGVVISIYKS